MDRSNGIMFSQFISKSQRLFGRPGCDKSTRIGSSLTYCRLRSLFRIPVVHADSSSSATRVMEERMATQKALPAVMVSESDINAYLAKETGLDRLKVMYSRTDSGKISPEIEYIIFAMTNACGLAFIMSSLFTGLRAREQYLQKNKVTVFKTRFKAHRLMNDKILIEVGKDGLKWSLRIGSFLLPFLLLSQTISMYRNKSSVLDYVAGSALSGFLIKLSLGLKGGLAGALIGSGMGLVSGTMIYGMLYASGDLQENRYYRVVQKKLEKEKEVRIMLGKEDMASEISSSGTQAI